MFHSPSLKFTCMYTCRHRLRYLAVCPCVLVDFCFANVFRQHIPGNGYTYMYNVIIASYMYTCIITHVHFMYMCVYVAGVHFSVHLLTMWKESCFPDFWMLLDAFLPTAKVLTVAVEYFGVICMYEQGSTCIHFWNISSRRKMKLWMSLLSEFDACSAVDTNFSPMIHFVSCSCTGLGDRQDKSMTSLYESRLFEVMSTVFSQYFLMHHHCTYRYNVHVV